MLISEELARSTYADRLQQARAAQQGHRLAAAARLARKAQRAALRAQRAALKAERAALKARLVLARVI